MFIALSIGRHDALKSYLNDISAYDQAIWNTLHGRFMQISISAYNEPNLFTSRFSPILLFFVPLYAIYSSPKWFLILQVFSVGASAIPIYLFSKEKLKSVALGLMILIAYLFYPLLHNGLLYDFHEVVFAVGFASWTFYFLEKNNTKLFILFSILLILTQEYMALLVFGMAIYQIFIKKRWRFGSALAFGSLLYYLTIVAFVMPHMALSGKVAFLANTGTYPSRYAWLGSSPTEIIKNILAHPIALTEILLSHDRLIYIFQLVIPVFSLALFSWPMAIIIPVLPLYLLSSNPMTYNVFFYHSAIFAPFIYFSAILTIERIFSNNLFFKRMFAGLILIFSIGSAVFFGVSPISKYYKLSDYIPSTHAKNISKVESLVPANASLSVQHNLGPHFSERQYLYRFPLMKDEAQYILLDQTNVYQDNPNQIFTFPYALQMDVGEWQKDIQDLKNSSAYALIYNQDGYLLFKKK
jgi:uncharacterized membrane protein